MFIAPISAEGGKVSKKQDRPVTRTKNPEPDQKTTDWVIWAAWADRITFEEIEERCGMSEAEVIKLMRRSLKRRSFDRWRKRVAQQSIKHRRRFQKERQGLKRRPKRAWMELDSEQ